MYESVKVEISGICPLICHNGHLADPLSPFAKRMKEVSGKRKKTDSDHEAMGRIEFEGGMYLNADGLPAMPSTNIEAMIVAGAKKSKEGTDAKAGLIVESDDWPIIYSGPKTIEDLWKDKRFVNRVSSRVGTSKIMRTRPIFPAWSLEFTVLYMADVVNKSRLKAWIEVGGTLVGLGDWRPRYGRFTVEKFV